MRARTVILSPLHIHLHIHVPVHVALQPNKTHPKQRLHVVWREPDATATTTATVGLMVAGAAACKHVVQQRVQLVIQRQAASGTAPRLVPRGLR